MKLWNLLLSASFTAFFAACSSQVAGGSSEETNTIAGTLTLPNGNAAARVALALELTTESDSIYRDTTDENGTFSLAPKAHGIYGLSAQVKDFAFYDTVAFYGKSVSKNGKFAKSDTISGSVYLRENVAASGATVTLAGSKWSAITDDNGEFVLNGIPEGSFEISVISPLPTFVQSAAYSTSDSTLQDDSSKYIFKLPLTANYALKANWTFDVLVNNTVSDMSANSGSAILYGDASLEKGKDNFKALHLNFASDFAIVEDDNGILDSATEFSVEAWVNIQKISSDSAVIANIFGKLGFSDSAVFSLAIVQDTCGVRGTHFAFFTASGNGDSLSCETAAIAKDVEVSSEWTYLAAAWNGDSAKIFVNGTFAGSAPSKFKRLVSANGIPLYFGKENVTMDLDNVRISTVAIEAVDAKDRYQK